MSDPHDGDQEKEWIVDSIHTATSVYVAGDGTEFPYFYMECYVMGKEPVKLLFSPPLAVGMVSDVMVMMKQIFGVEDLKVEDMNMQLDMPIDWDNLPPAPKESNQPDKHEENE